VEEEKSIFDIAQLLKGTFLPPKLYVYDQNPEDVRTYDDLSLVARTFLLLEDPTCSLGAKCINVVVILTILLSCAAFIIGSVGDFQESPSSCLEYACENVPGVCPGEKICEPEPKRVFEIIEMICIILFSIDYVTRVCTVWSVPARLAGLVPRDWDDAWVEITLESQKDTAEVGSSNIDVLQKAKLKDSVKEERTMTKFHQTAAYCLCLFNIIDLGAILPWYLRFAIASQGSSLAVIRILRLARVFRIFKLGKNNRSVELLSKTLAASTSVLVLLLFFFVLAVVVFGALVFYIEEGSFKVTADFPNGAYLRKNLISGEYEESTFVSMWAGFYWAVITLTTTGYGDLVPLSDIGRFVANVCMLTGVLMVALPISVVGSNFNTEYNIVHGEQTDNDMIYSCLLELSCDDSVDLSDLRPISSEEKNRRAVSAITAIISTLDTVKIKKVKKACILNLTCGGNLLPEGASPKDSILGLPNEPTRRENSQMVDSLMMETARHAVSTGLHIENIDFARYLSQAEQEANERLVAREGRGNCIVMNAIGDTPAGVGDNSKKSQVSEKSEKSSLALVTQLLQDIIIVFRAGTEEEARNVTGDSDGAHKNADFDSEIQRADYEKFLRGLTELRVMSLKSVPLIERGMFFATLYQTLCMHAAVESNESIDEILREKIDIVGYVVGGKFYNLGQMLLLSQSLRKSVIDARARDVDEAAKEKEAIGTVIKELQSTNRV
jgi:hypothetical protein